MTVFCIFLCKGSMSASCNFKIFRGECPILWRLRLFHVCLKWTLLPLAQSWIRHWIWLIDWLIGVCICCVWQVLGIDEDNARVMVSLAIGSSTTTVSQYAIKLVTKTEFDQCSKYLSKIFYCALCCIFLMIFCHYSWHIEYVCRYNEPIVLLMAAKHLALFCC